MKKIILWPALVFALTAAAQSPNDQNKKSKKTGKPLIGLGIKGGLNFANVTNASSINSSHRTGFMVGAFFSPPSQSIISSRTELIFSRQGYDFKANNSTGSVKLNYLVLPQLVGINITRFAQLQVGFQMAYLLNAKADSTNTSSPGPTSAIMDYYNRFDYGAAGGIEFYPVKNLLIGGRFNISFGKLYKEFSGNGTMQPSFIPQVDVKNNVVQVFAGFRF